MKLPFITLLVDDETLETFVRVDHVCDEHVGEEGRLFSIPPAVARVIGESVATIVRQYGTEILLDTGTRYPDEFKRPAELDDPDRKKLN